MPLLFPLWAQAEDELSCHFTGLTGRFLSPNYIDWAMFQGPDFMCSTEGSALEEGMATHFSILAWRIPWTEELRGLQSMGSPRVRHDWGDLARMHRRFPVSCSCNPILSVSNENSIPTLSVTFLSHHYHLTVCIWLRSASVLILQNSSVSILAIDWYIAVVIINAVSLWVQSNCGSLKAQSVMLQEVWSQTRWRKSKTKH